MGDREERLLEIFRHFDADGSGYIESNEFFDIAEVIMGKKPEDHEIQLIIDMGDVNGDGKIEPDEWVPLMNDIFSCETMPDSEFDALATRLMGCNLQEIEDVSREDKLMHLFELFDMDGSGYIETEEFVDIAEVIMGRKPTEDDIQLIIDMGDSNGDGKIEPSEWVPLMNDIFGVPSMDEAEFHALIRKLMKAALKQGKKRASS